MDNDITLYAFWKLSDLEKPICSLKIASSTVTWDNKSDNIGVTEYGLSASNTPTYNSSNSLSLSTGTFYGFVKDAVGNTNSCSLTIKSTTPSYKVTTTTCESTPIPTHKCWKNRTTYTYYQTKTRTCNKNTS